MDKRIQLFSLPIDAVTREEAIARIIRFLHEDEQRHVVTLNPEMALAAQEHAGLREAIHKADLVVPDGIGLVWAGWMLKRRIPERVSGTEMIERLARPLSFFQMRLCFLGGREGAAEGAALFFHDRYPELTLLWAGEEFSVTDKGILHQSSLEVWERLRKELTDGPPTLLAVALGSPKQELWIARHISQLPTVKVALGVGGALDTFAGITPRVPVPMRAAGLEWIWRLVSQPRRIRRVVRLASLYPALVYRELKKRRERYE